jgi:hypothetical protein
LHLQATRATFHGPLLVDKWKDKSTETTMNQIVDLYTVPNLQYYRVEYRNVHIQPPNFRCNPDGSK